MRFATQWGDNSLTSRNSSWRPQVRLCVVQMSSSAHGLLCGALDEARTHLCLPNISLFDISSEDRLVHRQTAHLLQMPTTYRCQRSSKNGFCSRNHFI